MIESEAMHEQATATFPARAVPASPVGAFYDKTQILFDLFWARDACHLGFWEKDTASLAEAIRNTNRFVAQALDIQEVDRVLDVGCGTGGTSIYLAENCGATVVGITLSQYQLERARRASRSSTASKDLLFLKRDFADRKSTRLNSSHEWISYAVFCLKKKKKLRTHQRKELRLGVLRPAPTIRWSAPVRANNTGSRIRLVTADHCQTTQSLRQRQTVMQ